MADLRTADGVRLRYRDTGSGPAILLVHGWAMSGRFFDALVDRLSHDHRCIAPDLRGCGDSEARGGTHTMDRFARDLEEILDASGVPSATLVGWSMGGGVVMRYLDRFGPARVRAVALVDFPPEFTEDPAVTERFVTRLRTDRERVIGAFLRRMVLDPRPETVAWMMAEHLKCATDTAVEMYRQLGLGSAVGQRHDLPALLAFPAQGWYRSALPTWQTIFPRHAAPAFGRSRHCPFLEEPDAFAAAVRQVEEL